MLMALYIIILIINIFLLIVKKYPKFVFLIDFLFFLLLFYGTTSTNDYSYYVLMYEKGLNLTSYEIGFNTILKLIQYTGVSFQGCMGIIWVIFGGIIIFVFSRYTKNYPLFFSLYLIYLVFIDIIQIKSFCATAILTLAFHFYFSGKKIKYLFFTIVAASIHIEMLFFIPLIFLNSSKLKSQKFVKRCGQGILVTCVIFFFARDFLNSIISHYGISLINALGGSDKTVYFMTSTNIGFLLYFVLHLVTIYITFFLKKKSSMSNFAILNKCKMIEQVQLLQFYCLLCFPLIMVNMNFYRLYRVTSFANYIAWAYILEKNMGRTIGYYKCLLMVLLSNILYRIPIVQGNDQIHVIINSNSIIR